MRIIIALLISFPLLAQVSLYGTLGAVESGYWSSHRLSFGAGAAFTHDRLSVGAEVWMSEVDRQRNPLLNGDRRAEAVHASVGYRLLGGLHAEGGGGVQRLTDTQYGPLIVGQQKYSAPFGSAGGYYQIGKRVFARVGYRHLFVRNDHNTGQTYVSVGISFGGKQHE